MIISLFNILSHFFYIMNRLEKIIIDPQISSLILTTLIGKILIFHQKNKTMSQQNKAREKQVSLLLLENKHYASVFTKLITFIIRI